jgi:hypothetical protein
LQNQSQKAMKLVAGMAHYFPCINNVLPT